MPQECPAGQPPEVSGLHDPDPAAASSRQASARARTSHAAGSGVRRASRSVLAATGGGGAPKAASSGRAVHARASQRRIGFDLAKTPKRIVIRQNLA